MAKKKQLKRKVTKKKVTKRKVTKRQTRSRSTDTNVTITTDTGVSVGIAFGKELQTLAMRWRYILSRRSRWKRSSQGNMLKQAFEAITQMIPAQELKQVLHRANMVEVKVPYSEEKQGWEGRITPWEFLISAAADGVENNNSITVTRHLNLSQKKVPAAKQLKILYVQCSPGVLHDYYDFSTEQAILKRVANELDIIECINPTKDELKATIIEHQPNVIHIAGIDNHQAKDLLKDTEVLPQEWQEKDPKDGIVLTSSTPMVDSGLESIKAEDLAQILNSGAKPVNLVTTNVYHSASRICAMAVAEGAGIAIGFQDTINDALAEVFIREFYNSWIESRQTLPCFKQAIQEARTVGSLSGTGIVLWSSQSLLDTPDIKSDSLPETSTTTKALSLKNDDNYADWLQVDIQIRKRLNYSLLHNDSGGLFEKFEFRKDKSGILRDVNVEVTLYLGSESHPYNSRFTLENYLTKIEDQIKIPLTSSIIRTVSEPLRTSLFVKVTIGSKIVYQRTDRVTLLPADEWKDSETDRVWLPSFILPRDPAVDQVLDRARKHLMTLADNRDTSFDGYQALDPDDTKSMENIDLQVRALWATIVGDYGIRYISPPPSYSKYGQRLRTPTQIVANRYGTCIDLALLFAACLEQIDIYPVIFLLEGHAFSGYWRNDERYMRFMEASQDDVADLTLMGSTNQGKETSPWVFPFESYQEILNEIDKGYLNPLETTAITEQGSFKDAIKQGKAELSVRNNFHALIDLKLARSEFITPLPIIDI